MNDRRDNSRPGRRQRGFWARGWWSATTARRPRCCRRIRRKRTAARKGRRRRGGVWTWSERRLGRRRESSVNSGVSSEGVPLEVSGKRSLKNQPHWLAQRQRHRQRGKPRAEIQRENHRQDHRFGSQKWLKLRELRPGHRH